MNDMYGFLSPAYIPFTDTPLGIWPMSKFESGVEKFAKDREVSFKGVHDNLKDIEVIQPNENEWSQSSFATHWVVITELTVDDITDKTRVKVSTWGGYSYLNLDAYLEGTSIYQCLLYFE